MLRTWLFMVLFYYQLRLYLCLKSDVIDPKTNVRLNEIHINVGLLGDSTDFTFVEVFSPVPTLDLTGLTVVFYSASTLTSFDYCSCDNVLTNNLGYGLCNCGLGKSTTVTIGAVALHNAPSSVFKGNSIPATQALTLNMTDVILYQTYGSLNVNALQPIFTPGQQYHYPPPVSKSDYSVVRCYGDPTTNDKWQASFTWVLTATQNAPNQCPVPSIYLNEIHLNKNYIELASLTEELPLDEATIAVIVDDGKDAVVFASYPLTNQRIRPDFMFTIGAIIGADVLDYLHLPITQPTAVAIYFNVTVTQNATALPTNITSSVVYSNVVNLNNTLPKNLQPFGDKMYPIDLSGNCSLCSCSNQSDIRSASPTPLTVNNCTIACSLNNLQATVRLSEVRSSLQWSDSAVTFKFMEVFTPLGSIDLTGLSIVFYSGDDLKSYNCCTCNGIRTNNEGYALCDCGPRGMSRIPADVALQGAIVLQLVDASYFINPVPFAFFFHASIGSQLNVIDSILYQSYGPVDYRNPLKNYFAPGQHFVIPPPPTQTTFSIVRCYGDPLTTGTWQASFLTVYQSTPDAPNPCPPPTIIVNEIHFNSDFVQLNTVPEELPLDQVTLAYLAEDGIITKVFPLAEQKAGSNNFFSIGQYAGVTMNEEINLPTANSTAIVVYFNISVVENQIGPNSSFLSSLIYSQTSTNVPANLLPFGNETFQIDSSGRCSLSICDQQNASDYQIIATSINTKINCTAMPCD